MFKIIKMKSVCIIGCNGYIGSALMEQLTGCIITGNNDKNFIYTKDYIEKFNVVLYLGGPRSRTCTNKDNIMDVASLMGLDQTLIYASTTAVYEGLLLAKEDTCIDVTNLDTYSISMITREKSLFNITNTNIVGLRLATVSGLSPTLRLDRIHIQMLKSALLTGKITVNSALQRRPVISMKETVEAFQLLINNPPIEQHVVYNICAFNTTICSIASEIAHITNAKINYISTIDSVGFSVNGEKFIRDYGMVYFSNNQSIIMDLLDNNIISHIENKVCDVTCIVCENKVMSLLVDLGSTALANQFLPAHVECQTYPLSLYRCMNCFHNQLGHIVPSNIMFDDYIYVSGTAKTNLDYFEGFANKVTTNFKNNNNNNNNVTLHTTIGDIVNNNINNVLKNASGNFIGTVLDIACNDGSQLDFLKKQNWKTYGVDPAANLYKTSSEKGHEVVVGYWGMLEPNNLPLTFDIIIAQNVFAHVPNPRLFLETCKHSMHIGSILYIQTSQAELFEQGEHDTVYHEHISFFTIKSMHYLSVLCGIYLESVEKVDIHGTSYVFQFRLRKEGDNEMSDNVKLMIEKESQIYQPENVEMYSMHVQEKRKIISNIMDVYVNYKIIGFGSSAKGNTLLSSLYTKNLPKYIIDENPLKQGLYTPGAKIPVVKYECLEQEEDNVLILVLAWNFLDEIKEKVRKSRDGSSKITALLIPFPTTTIEVLFEGNYHVMSQFPLYDCLSNIKNNGLSNNSGLNNINSCLANKPVEKLLISHFYNEEFLLPYWIMHHAPMFKNAVLINHHSTDKSCDIIRELAPSTWTIIDTECESFDATLTDDEVRKVERAYADDIWKLGLTTTEFLVWPTIEEDLKNSTHNCYKVHAMNMVGNDALPLNLQLPLVKQRNRANNETSQYHRYIHKNNNTTNDLYVIGRHYVRIPFVDTPNAFIAKYLFTPWPESIPRKLQIAKRQSQRDVYYQLGLQHQCTLESLTNEKIKHDADLAINFFDYGLADNLSLLRSKILYNQIGDPWIHKV